MMRTITKAFAAVVVTGAMLAGMAPAASANTAFDRLRHRVSRLEVRVDNLANRTSSLESENASLRLRVTTLEDGQASLRTRTSSLEDKTSRLDSSGRYSGPVDWSQLVVPSGCSFDYAIWQGTTGLNC